MLSITEFHDALHDLFHDTADDLARQTGFCQRRRKLTGSVFAKTLVFTLLQNPNATLADYADTAYELLDVSVTPQAFDKRFTPEAACLLQSLFLEAFNRSFNSLRPALLPLLRHFTEVTLRDATLVSLPASLAAFFPGRGGRHLPHGQAAALKLVLEVEVKTGALTEVSLLAGLDNEKSAAVADKPLAKGALLLEDMGFFCGDRLQTAIDQEAFVLTRIPAWTAVFDLKGPRLDLVKLLRQHKQDRLVRQVRILHGHKLQLRLLAVRVPQEEAQKRRERVRQEAKQRGRPVSQRKLDLCEWNILLTNAPAKLLGFEEAFVMRRVRWQIELVFKVFKSEGQSDQSRVECPNRSLCELFAKLLAMVVQHWTLLASGYQMLVHSARRAARRVRQRALKLLRGIEEIERLAREIGRLARLLHRHCRLQRRKRSPSTWDRLRALDPDFDQTQEAA